jgi:hypothetical protein
MLASLALFSVAEPTSSLLEGNLLIDREVAQLMGC